MLHKATSIAITQGINWLKDKRVDFIKSTHHTVYTFNIVDYKQRHRRTSYPTGG